MSVIFSIWTVVACVIFLGIVAWAWSSRRKADFEAAARLALDLDNDDWKAHDG